MKVFFGSSLDEMMRELRGQDTPSVRLHVLPETRGQHSVLCAHVTTFCNGMIYEAVVEEAVALDGVPADRAADYLRHRCDGLRKNVAERLKGIEIRDGVLQE